MKPNTEIRGVEKQLQSSLTKHSSSLIGQLEGKDVPQLFTLIKNVLQVSEKSKKTCEYLLLQHITSDNNHHRRGPHRPTVG